MAITPIPAGNLFERSQAPAEGERFEDLLRLGPLQIERILSSRRPDTSVCKQPQDEWVCLLRGQARLWIDGEFVDLNPGDYRFIPAQTPHRVLETSANPACLWLAVHWRPQSQGILPHDGAA